jgi:hypothetical protein
MSASAALKEAADHGIKLWLDGERLKFAAKSNTPKYLLEKLRIHKADIVAVLQQEAPPKPNPVALEERKVAEVAEVARGKSKKAILEGPTDAAPDPIAADRVPERYADAWARFQLQCPNGISEELWRQAIADAGRFLNQWGKLADSFGWSPGDLFDVPRDGATGLVWWLKGRTVSTLGPEHACVGQPAYDRVTRTDWVNPYKRQVRPVSISPILEHQLKIMQRVLGR